MSNSVPLPKYQTEGSACFDLCFHKHSHNTFRGYNNYSGAFERNFGPDGSVGLAPGDRVLLPTGLIFDIQPGYSVRIHPRSSMAVSRGVGLSNSEGIIDSDYFDECFVPVINNTINRVVIASGDRIAQAELVPVTQAEIVETNAKPVKTTSRSGGFGSTGK